MGGHAAGDRRPATRKLLGIGDLPLVGNAHELNGLCVDHAHQRFIAGAPLAPPWGRTGGACGACAQPSLKSNHRGDEGLQLLVTVLRLDALYHFVCGGVATNPALRERSMAATSPVRARERLFRRSPHARAVADW